MAASLNSTNQSTCDHRSNPDPSFIGTFSLLSIGISILILSTLRQLPSVADRIPFTLLLLIYGIIFALLDINNEFGAVSYSLHVWLQLNPSLLMVLLLPPLLFTSGFVIHFHVFKVLAGQAILLASIGVIISLLLTAAIAVFIFPYGWSWIEALAFGSLLAATDPVAVVALLKELGAPATYGVLIEGESLINDGSALVFFMAFEQAMIGIKDPTAGAIVVGIIYCSVIGPLCGLILGRIILEFMKLVWDDAMLLSALTVIAAWGAYFLGDITQSSGVLSVVCIGIYLGGNCKPHISAEAHASLVKFWQTIEFGANTMVFVFAGAVITHKVLGVDTTTNFTPTDFGMLLVLFIALNLIRAVAVIIQWPALAVMGYGMEWKKAIITAFAGLRGGVALLSALFVLKECKCGDTHTTPCLSQYTADLIMFFTAGIVFLTLVVNAPLSKPLLRALRVSKKTAAAKEIFKTAMFNLHEDNDGDIEQMKNIKTYKGANWDLVHSFVPIFSTEYIEKTATQRHWNQHIKKEVDQSIKNHLESRMNTMFSIKDSDPETTQLIEARLRYLNLVKNYYHKRFSEGACTSWPAMDVLVHAAERAQDKPKKEMNEWKNSIARIYCDIPQLYQTTFEVYFYRKYFHNYFLSGKLIMGYDIACSFVTAHEYAEHEIKKLRFPENILQKILQESKSMLDEARRFALDIEIAFPEVMESTKTTMAAQKMLNSLTNHVDDLAEKAIIDEADKEAILQGLKKKRSQLLNHSRFGVLESEDDLLTKSNLFHAVDEEERQLIRQHAKLRLFNYGDEIYEDASKCYAIVRGRIKMTMFRHLTKEEQEKAAEKKSGDERHAYEMAKNREMSAKGMGKVAQIIKSFGRKSLVSKNIEATLKFGELNEKFGDHSDLLARILVRGKKMDRFQYLGNMLFGGVHDDVDVSLVKGWFKESMREADVPDYPTWKRETNEMNNTDELDGANSNLGRDFIVGATGHVYRTHRHHPAMGHYAIRPDSYRDHFNLHEETNSEIGAVSASSLSSRKKKKYKKIAKRGTRQTRSLSCDSDGHFKAMTRLPLKNTFEHEQDGVPKSLRRNSFDLTPTDTKSSKSGSNKDEENFVTATLRKTRDWTKTTSSFDAAPGKVVSNAANYKIQHKSILKTMKQVSSQINSTLGISFKSDAASRPDNRITEEYLAQMGTSSRELFTSYAVAGDIFGAIELISEAPIVAHAVCDSAVAAYEIPSEILRDFVLRSPDGAVSTNLVRQAGLHGFELHYPQIQKISHQMRRWIFQRMDMISASDNLEFMLKPGKACLIHGYINKVSGASVDPPIRSITVFDSPNAIVSGVGHCMVAHLPSSFCMLLEQHKDALVDQFVEPSHLRIKKSDFQKKVVLPWLMHSARMRQRIRETRILPLNGEEEEEKADGAGFNRVREIGV